MPEKNVSKHGKITVLLLAVGQLLAKLQNSIILNKH